MLKNKHYICAHLSTLSVLVLLTACGGGSSNPPPPPPPPVNQAPTVTIGSNFSAPEQTQVDISATASDTDGSIASYAWTQTAGDPVTLTGDTTASISFDAPVAKTPIDLAFSLTVTDNDGATASDSIVVTIDPVNEIAFTLKGKVTTDNPISGSTVEFSYINNTVTAVSDANGDYELLIETDEDDVEAMVNIFASGPDAHVQFAAVPKTLQQWFDLAGTDGIVDVSDTIDVNITNFTTALYGQIIHLNNGFDPVSMDELAKSSKLVSAGELLASSTVIALMVDHGIVDGVDLSLPAGMTTFDFAKDKNLRIPYIWQIREVSTQPTSLYNLLYVNLLAEPNLFNVQGIDSAVTAYYANSFADAQKISVDQGGTGSYYRSPVKLDFTWAQGSPSDLSFDQTAVTTDFPVIDINGFSTQVERQTIYDSAEFRLLYKGLQNDLVTLSISQRYHYPNGELPDEVLPVQTQNVYYLRNDAVDAFLPGDVQGIMTAPLPREVFSTNTTISTPAGDRSTESSNATDRFAINADNSMSSLNLNLGSGSWDIQGAENYLRITLSPYLIDIYKLADNYYYSEVTENGAHAGSHNSFASVNNSGYAWDAASVPGVYDLDYQTTNPVRFWLEFNADNTATTNSGRDTDNDGILSAGEVTSEPGDWRIEGDKLIVSRYRVIGSFAVCAPGEFNCALYNEREMTLGQIVNDRYYATNNHIFYLYNIFESTVPELVDVPSNIFFDSRYWIKDTQPLFPVVPKLTGSQQKLSIKDQLENEVRFVYDGLNRYFE